MNFSRKGTLLIAVSCQNQLLSPFSLDHCWILLADGHVDVMASRHIPVCWQNRLLFPFLNVLLVFLLQMVTLRPTMPSNFFSWNWEIELLSPSHGAFIVSHCWWSHWWPYSQCMDCSPLKMATLMTSSALRSPWLCRLNLNSAHPLKICWLFQVLAADPVLRPQLCTLQPCPVLESVVGWAALKRLRWP